MAYRNHFENQIFHNHDLHHNHNHLPLFLNDDYGLVASPEDDPETPSYPSESDPTASDSPSPSTTASASTISSSSSPSASSTESSEQASPHQPSSPQDHFRNFYGANLPPSPLHHYYTAVYPPPPQPPPPSRPLSQPMVQTRASSRPPAASSSRNSNGSTRTTRGFPPSRHGSSSASAAPIQRNSLPVRQNKPTPIVDLTSLTPGESRTTASSSHPSRKRRRTDGDTPTILLEDDDETADETDEYERIESSPVPQKPIPVPEEKPKKLAGMACIICMEDEPVDLSVTPCGHMFCNKCLYGAIKATLSAPHKVHGKCPVCRGKVAIKDIVVLEIKQRSKGKERAH